jgi:hypothetical protein
MGMLDASALLNRCYGVEAEKYTHMIRFQADELYDLIMQVEEGKEISGVDP